jgi:tetratricopeptide (TPR) repeat protein
MVDWLKHLEYGYKALEEGKRNVATTHFMAAWELNPEDAVTCYAYARLLVESENWIEAEPLLKKAWSIDPSMVDSACEWARVNTIITGKSNKSLDFLDQLNQNNKEEFLIPLTQIEIYLRIGDSDSARLALESAELRGANPSMVKTAGAKIEQLEGLKLIESKEFARADSCFEKASLLDPYWAAPLINMGASRENQGKLVEARSFYAKALTLEPLNPVALYNIARMEKRLGDIEKAAGMVKKLLEVDPEYPGAGDLASEILEVS